MVEEKNDDEGWSPD